jgi:signal transduction histidine kinase
MFSGLTAASCMSLWLNQRDLIENHHRSMLSRTQEFDRCTGLTDKRHSLETSTAESSLQEGAQPISPSDSVLKTCLNRYSAHKNILWIEKNDGRLLRADSKYQPATTSQIIHNGTLLNPARSLHKTSIVKVKGLDYIVHLHHRYSNGDILWTSEEITESTSKEGSYLTGIILIWGSSLLLMVFAVAYVVKRIVSPLDQLNDQLRLMSADSLKTSRVHLDRAPQEIEELALAYNNLLSRLSDAWSLQRQFVSGVSHELRNPLMIISGYLKRIIRKGSNLTIDQRKQLQVVEHESERINRMITDLLDLSREDSGRLHIEVKMVELQSLLNEVINFAQPTTPNPITILTPDRISGGKPIHAKANHDRLKQVLLNLIENAQKYSTPGSPITLELKQLDNTALIEVNDEGLGIPEVDRPHVFERFYRGNNVASQVGSGLGLSVVQLLVEAMGGSISLESKPGPGSCFRIRLSLC